MLGPALSCLSNLQFILAMRPSRNEEMIFKHESLNFESVSCTPEEENDDDGGNDDSGNDDDEDDGDKVEAALIPNCAELRQINLITNDCFPPSFSASPHWTSDRF